jgi:hypothetical protein
MRKDKARSNKIDWTFGEYEDLGAQLQSIQSEIARINLAMSNSRRIGAFKALQDQMREIKNLVKLKQKVDARMSVLDLARKKTDDHLYNTGQYTSYSEKAEDIGERIKQLEELVNSDIKYTEALQDNENITEHNFSEEKPMPKAKPSFKVMSDSAKETLREFHETSIELRHTLKALSFSEPGLIRDSIKKKSEHLRNKVESYREKLNTELA